MSLYVPTNHREERARARVARLRLLSAVVVVTALSIASPLGNAVAATYPTVAFGLEQALRH
jgi:hypothetical protein